MSTVRQLHDKAAELGQLAMIARYKGDEKQAKSLARRAYEYEVQAAELVPDIESAEPTRSILYLSAASFAYQCKEFQAAQRLVAKGLSGYPPPKVEQDLKNLFEQLNFERHLEVHDVILEERDLQLSMAGKSVGYGMIVYKEFKKTVDRTIELINRTVERKMGSKYRSGAGRPRSVYRPFIPALSVARPGSFVITLRLGIEEVQQTSYLFSASKVIDEILTGVELINSHGKEGLEQFIENDSYRLQFLSTVRDMAPDGERINFVGLTSKSRSVSLTRLRSDIDLPEIEPTNGEEKERKPIEVEGILDVAIGRGKKSIIELNPEDSDPLKIVVEEGLEDVVRSYFGQWVVVTGIFVRDVKGNEHVYLKDVHQ